METDAVIRTHAAPVETAPARVPPTRVVWRAVLGGSVVAVATWMLLQLLGFGVGLTAVDVTSTSSLQGSAIGTGIWGVAAPVIAFFVGGLVTGRAAAGIDRAGGALSGLVMWGMTALAGILLVGMAVSSLVGGALSIGKSAAGVAGDAIGQAASGIAGQAHNMDDVAQAMGIDADDALAPVNQRLRAQGKPEITAQQLESAARTVVRNAVRAGKLDRPMLVRAIADRTALSEQDAQDIASRVETQYERARAEVAAKATEAKNMALRATQATTEATGKLMLGLFGALLLAAGASVAGAALGGRPLRRGHRQR